LNNINLEENKYNSKNISELNLNIFRETKSLNELNYEYVKFFQKNKIIQVPYNELDLEHLIIFNILLKL